MMRIPKALVFILLSITCSLSLHASELASRTGGRSAVLPKIRIVNTEGSFDPLAAQIPEWCPGWPKGAFSERPPWVVRFPDGKLRCFIGTNHSLAYMVNPGESLLSDSNPFDIQSGYVASRGLLPRGDVEWPSPQSLMESPSYWRSHYYGISTAHLISHPETGLPMLIALLHGENKDMKWSPEWARKNNRKWYLWPSTILPPLGDESEERDSYCAFVGLAWSPLDEAAGANFMEHDLGPVIWPQQPYLDDQGLKVTTGVRHPYGFVNEGFFYAYYKDHVDGSIRVARAPLDRILEPGSLKVFSDGAFREPALPSDFRKGDRSFLKMRGGKGDPVLPGGFNSARFQVSKLEGTPYFLGIEHRQSSEAGRAFYEVWLHISKDLVNWSRGTPVPGTGGSQYNSRLGQRPILVNRDYTGHEEIDPNGFYIAGKRDPGRSGVFVHYLEIELLESDSEMD